jgi:response regulator RpfG family c-di-GMP phosphodiesterase
MTMDNSTPVSRHTILCVDDEINILNALKRLLRREDYTLLTASSGNEGLEMLAVNDVHLVLSDQRMPGMSGTEFLAEIKEKYPDIIRIILTGYTEVDTITESINRGHIYKFFLKPWNDENLKLEIRKALDQYDLIKANERLTRTVMEQNLILKRMNDELEDKVRQRTSDLELRNQALELSQAILEDVPLAIVGVNADQTVVLMNRMAMGIAIGGRGLLMGENLSDYFSQDILDMTAAVFRENRPMTVPCDSIPEVRRTMDILPLSGPYMGKGVILVIYPEVTLGG